MPVARYFKRLVETRPHAIETMVGSLVFAGLPAAIGALLGFAFGDWACFALYFPAILLSALLLDWQAGFIVTLLSAISSNYFLARSPMAMGLNREGLLAAIEYWVSAVLIVIVASSARRLVAQLNAAAARERALNEELRHRVNNSLALALAFASQTRRSTPEPEVFYATFRSRLMALARAQDILSSEDWAECELPNVAEKALEAFGERGEISLSGVRCSVPSGSCVPLVLALHELATNAVKYGALSAPGGCVSLSWTIKNEGDARPEIVMQWVESGGPPVQPPTRQGLGSRLLVRQSGLDSVSIEYDRAGLRCTIVVLGETSGRSARSARAEQRSLSLV
jgi:two-component sensor histidine kinase